MLQRHAITLLPFAMLASANSNPIYQPHNADFRLCCPFIDEVDDFISPIRLYPNASQFSLPKPEYHYSDSASKPDVNLSVHPAPQLLGVCHTHLLVRDFISGRFNIVAVSMK
jgi:hypothetical protein